MQRQSSIPQLCMDFIPTTYASNNHTVNSNQGLGVVKICVHYILPRRKIGLFQQDSLWEWQKEFEIVSMFVGFKQFIIPWMNTELNIQTLDNGHHTLSLWAQLLSNCKKWDSVRSQIWPFICQHIHPHRWGLFFLWNTWHPKHLIFTHLQQATPCKQLAIHKARLLTDCFTCRHNPVTWRLHKEQKTVFEFTWNTSDRSSLLDLDLCDFISHILGTWPPSHAVMREMGRMVLLIRWIMCCQQ